MSEVKEILSKLNHIEADLKFIKNRLSDVDLVLTDDDVASLQKAESDLKKGKTKVL